LVGASKRGADERVELGPAWLRPAEAGTACGGPRSKRAPPGARPRSVGDQSRQLPKLGRRRSVFSPLCGSGYFQANGCCHPSCQQSPLWATRHAISRTPPAFLASLRQRQSHRCQRSPWASRPWAAENAPRIVIPPVSENLGLWLGRDALSRVGVGDAGHFNRNG